MRIAFAFVLVFSAPLVPQGWLADIHWAHGGGAAKAFDLSGSQVLSSTGGGLGAGNFGTAVDGQRRVWMTQWAPGQNTVTCLSSLGQILFVVPAGPAASGGPASVGPLAINAQGQVFVGDPRDGVAASITRLDAQGQNPMTFVVPGRSVRSLAIDSEGDLWALVYDATGSPGHVHKFSPNGVLLLTIASGTSVPNTVFADERGRVLITHTPTPDQILIVNLAGAPLGTLGSNYNNHFRAVHSAVDGRIFASGLFAIEVFSSTGISVANLSTGATTATSLVVDITGVLWACLPQFGSATNSGTIRLRRFPSLGPPTDIVVGSAGPSTSSLNIGDPMGLLRARVVDPRGDIDQDGHDNLAEVTLGASAFNALDRPCATLISGTPAIGQSFSIQIASIRQSGRPYFMPWSQNPTDLLLSILGTYDQRRFAISFQSSNALTLDPIWELSTSQSPPGLQIFPSTFGQLSSQGVATVTINVPNLTSLSGVVLHTAFCTFDPQHPNGIGAVSPQLTITF